MSLKDIGIYFVFHLYFLDLKVGPGPFGSKLVTGVQIIVKNFRTGSVGEFAYNFPRKGGGWN